MHFETPHNDIKCVLSIIESYSNEKNGSKFACGEPDRKISLFLTTSLAHNLIFAVDVIFNN